MVCLVTSPIPHSNNKTHCLVIWIDSHILQFPVTNYSSCVLLYMFPLHLLKDTLTRFMDTLSLHVCVAGQTNAQKGLWTHKDGASKVRGGGEEDWMSVSCPNGLADVHWLYVGALKGRERLSKDLRNTFVKGKIHDVRKNFQVREGFQKREGLLEGGAFRNGRGFQKREGLLEEGGATRRRGGY